MTTHEEATMTSQVSEVVQRVVAGCIERREWRSSAEEAACAYVKSKADREAVKRYVREQYDAAGAGFAGRWQGSK